jgi:hypothetical protein
MKTKLESRFILGATIIYKGSCYFHPALYSHRGLFTVLVRPIRDKLKVYSPNGKFICAAPKMEGLLINREQSQGGAA